MCDFDSDCGADMDVECDIDVDTGIETDSDLGEDIDSTLEDDLGAEMDNDFEDDLGVEIGDTFEGTDDYFDTDIDTNFDMDSNTEAEGLDDFDEISDLELPDDLRADELAEDSMIEPEALEIAEETEPELNITEEVLDEYLEETEDVDALNNLRDAVASGRLQVDTEELPEETEALEPEMSIPEEALDEFIGETEDVDTLSNLRDAVERGRLQVDVEESTEETETSEPELRVTGEILDELVDETEDVDTLNNLRDAVENGRLEVEMQEMEEEDSSEKLEEEEDIPEELEEEEDIPEELEEEEDISEELEEEEDIPEELEEEEDIPEELEEEEEIPKELEEEEELPEKLEKEEESEELEMEDIMRDVLQQNVTKQKLPSARRVEWLEEGTPGESNCRIRGDSELKIHDKASNSDITYTGREFSEHMKEKYGTDIVNYSHREPDFTPFEQEFTNESVSEFMQQKYGSEWGNLEGTAEGHVHLEHMDTRRNGGTFSQASDIVAERLGISREDVDDYMKTNNLTWHECGDRHTVRAIPSEINQAFGHTGGIGLQQDIEALAESINRVTGDKIALERGTLTGKIENLDEAVKEAHERNRMIKKELFK